MNEGKECRQIIEDKRKEIWKERFRGKSLPQKNESKMKRVQTNKIICPG
jgi:hypothetical protein